MITKSSTSGTTMKSSTRSGIADQAYGALIRARRPGGPGPRPGSLYP
jgi:hypothetical protein